MDDLVSDKCRTKSESYDLVSDECSDGFPSFRRPLSLLLFLSFWYLKAGQGQKMVQNDGRFEPIFGTCMAPTNSCATFITSSTEFSSPSFTHLSLVEAMY